MSSLAKSADFHLAQAGSVVLRCVSAHGDGDARGGMGCRDGVAEYPYTVGARNGRCSVRVHGHFSNFTVKHKYE